MIQYRLIADSNYVLVTRDGVTSTVPNDVENRDWVAYQAWLALGNTPEAA